MNEVQCFAIKVSLYLLMSLLGRTVSFSFVISFQLVKFHTPDFFNCADFVHFPVRPRYNGIKYCFTIFLILSERLCIMGFIYPPPPLKKNPCNIYFSTAQLIVKPKVQLHVDTQR